ncbi:hypothetical protein BpHYR1_005758 [Brachionus plicatilis]|uniref:Uncharacterized protein n=1 Tax=Brachionus plicatilis TaxID=10195 RepID=A0A3M7R6V0_BRAPC|nr:hypothetical protein BpHYR1_005758 [Brachionus plicatilis]
MVAAAAVVVVDGVEDVDADAVWPWAAAGCPLPPSWFGCTTSCEKLGIWNIWPLAVMNEMGCWLDWESSDTGMFMI